MYEPKKNVLSMFNWIFLGSSEQETITRQVIRFRTVRAPNGINTRLAHHPYILLPLNYGRSGGKEWGNWDDTCIYETRLQRRTHKKSKQALLNKSQWPDAVGACDGPGLCDQAGSEERMEKGKNSPKDICLQIQIYEFRVYNIHIYFKK